MQRFSVALLVPPNRESLTDNMLGFQSNKWHACCNRCSQPAKRLLNLITVRTRFKTRNQPKFASLALFLTLLASSVPLSVAADDRGTVGLVVRQLFSEKEPNHRGVLAVMHVVEDSPAA